LHSEPNRQGSRTYRYDAWGRPYGRRGLAAEPGPREVRGGIPRERDRRDVLPSLTAEDLKELGVSALGHRRILLDAIAALRADTGGKAPTADAASSIAKLRVLMIVTSEFEAPWLGRPYVTAIRRGRFPPAGWPVTKTDLANSPNSANLPQLHDIAPFTRNSASSTLGWGLRRLGASIMSPVEPDAIPDKVERTEKVLLWIIQNVLRGGWFRRCVFLLVIFAIFAFPAVISNALSAVGVNLPTWYNTAYWALTGLLVLVTLVVGAKTIPRLPQTAPSNIDQRAIRGLLPFNQEDSKLFSQLERGVLLRLVLGSLLDSTFRFGMLIGISGSGKTSFLRAGLLALLRESRVPAVYVELSNEDPLESIKRAIAQQGYEAPTGVLLLDQFEQFFLHQRTAEQRKPLIEALRDWHLRDSAIRVLISIRAEDAWQMHEIRENLDVQLSNRNVFILKKFEPEQAVRVVGIICENAGIAFNPDFVRTIVDQELRDEDGLVLPVDLGIIILVLATEGRTFTPESYSAYGGIDGVLDAWLTSQLAAARLANLEKAAIRTLSVLCDFDRNRRAGILSIEDITSRLSTDLSHGQVERAVQWLAS
jgi:SAM domain (Sterile alpha motif)